MLFRSQVLHKTLSPQKREYIESPKKAVDKWCLFYRDITTPVNGAKHGLAAERKCSGNRAPKKRTDTIRRKSAEGKECDGAAGECRARRHQNNRIPITRRLI